MAYVLQDRIQDTSTTTGTGSITVSGSPPVGFRTFSAVCAVGDTFPYAIAHRTANEWELGRATYTGTNTIARTFIEASSNAGSAVNFSAGTKDIWLNWSAGLAGGIAGQNLLINGDFQINQRAFAGGALTAGTYGFDRWKAATGGANCTLSGYTLTLASGELEQIVEPAAWGVASLASSRFTVSVDTPTADVTVTLGSASGTIPTGTGRCSVTLTTGVGDTGNLPFRIRRASGSNVAFGRIKLETGLVMTAWEPRPIQQEYGLACRYFWRPQDAGSWLLDGNAPTSGTYLTTFLAMPAEMRANPTATVTVGVTSNLLTGDPQGFLPVTRRSFGFYIRANASGRFFGNFTNIQMDAEL